MGVTRWLHAKNTKTDTSNFDNNLSSSDDTVQDALETLDDLNIETVSSY